MVSAPSSPLTLARGLNTSVVPSLEPPHRTPFSLTLVPLVMVNTSAPLSPPPTVAETIVWQSCVMLVPLTLTFTQVALTGPWLQPVVRPTLFTLRPMVKLDDDASEVMVQFPTMVRSVGLVLEVRAMRPSVFWVPLMYFAKAASLRRQCRPAGHEPPVG